MKSDPARRQMRREQFMEWALRRVAVADTARMLALLGLRARGTDLADLPRLPVDTYLDIVQTGADEGVNEDEVMVLLRRALERRLLEDPDS